MIILAPMNAFPNKFIRYSQKMPLKPPLPSLKLLPLVALAALLFQVNRKPSTIALFMQDFQLAILALHQRS
jgi:hypothetical protein